MINIIEVYKTNKNTVWVDNKTILCVFDDNNKLLADYDFYSGLKIMQNNINMTIFINESDLVSGNWVFSGEIDNHGKIKKVQSKGKAITNIKTRIYEDQDPWESRHGTKQSLANERERRMGICKICSSFDQINGVCTINNSFILDMTKFKDYYCPEDKWGNKSDVESAHSINIEQNQDQFNKELEEYLKGL